MEVLIVIRFSIVSVSLLLSINLFDYGCYRFLLQCLEDLDSSLRKLNSRLFVVRGQPADALPKLFREWGITALTFEEDPEPYGRVRDHNIMTKCREVGIAVTSRVSHTLYKLDRCIIYLIFFFIIDLLINIILKKCCVYLV